MHLVTGHQPHIDTIRDRRATRPAHSEEHLTMHAGQLGLTHCYAVQRHHDFLVEAERARLVASLSAENQRQSSPLRGLRLQIGAALVRVGEHLQGAQPEPAPALDTAIGTLRPAR